MGNIQEFIWVTLCLVLVAVIGFYIGRWIVFRIRLSRRKNKINKSNILGDGLAQPMEVYGSAVAPGRSSTIEITSHDIKANSLPFDFGEKSAGRKGGE